ncbi:MAG: cupin domain-containing protein [Lachnospiraceae bacterium]|nr:cupin domain-containing protein [Lachnospiraceae bacterium]
MIGYKNIEKEEIIELKKQVSYQQGQVVSKTLVQNNAVSITLFAFEGQEEISTHASGGDAMVTVLEGKGKFTIDGTEYVLNTGESIIMPAGKPHAVFAVERFKMLLTVVF